MNKATAYYHQNRPEMLALVPDGIEDVLDVGCGGGDFGSALKERCPGATLYGIEYNPEVASPLPIGFEKIWVGDVTLVLPTLPDQSFDLIVFNDLLEHLTDPRKVLELSIRLLKPGGKVMASIPNMRFWPVLSDLLFQGDWRYRDAGVMDETHLRFFTRKSMARLFEDAGYVVVQIHGINKTWVHSWRWRILNAMMLGKLEDCLFPQFALLAKVL